jgi:membrane-bound lytic murein transglycosylase B
MGIFRQVYNRLGSVLLAMLTLFLSFETVYASEWGEYSELYSALAKELEVRKVPGEWVAKHLNSDKFVVYISMPGLFHNMAERVVAREERDFEWYKNLFGLDLKVDMAKQFIDTHIDELEKVTARNGIPYELVVAILGMETNFASSAHKGRYYVFNSLVSQYILMEKRRPFAVEQLFHLYEFTRKTETDVFYYIGSFAGACGWAQFIPSSLNRFFIDARDIPEDIDIYDLDDTLHSIENYLYNSGLDEGTSWLKQSRWDAVYSYNRSSAYVEAVLYIFDSLIAQY